MTKAKTRKSKKARKDDKQETEVESPTDETGTTATAIQVADVVRDDKGWNVKLPAILNKKIVSYAKYAWGAVSKMADRWADIQRIAAQKQIDLEVCKEEFRYHARQVGMNRHQIDYALHAEQRREDARQRRLEHKQEFEEAKKTSEEEQETEEKRLNVETPDEPEKERDDDVTVTKIEDIITDDEHDGVTTTTAAVEEQRPEQEKQQTPQNDEEQEVWIEGGARTKVGFNTKIADLRRIVQMQSEGIGRLQLENIELTKLKEDFTAEISIPLLDIAAPASGIKKTEYKPKARKEFENRKVIVSVSIDAEAKTVEYLDLTVVEKQ